MTNLYVYIFEEEISIKSRPPDQDDVGNVINGILIVLYFNRDLNRYEQLAIDGTWEPLQEDT